MRKINVIQRWLAAVILVMFALQETNGGRFPSVYDGLWRSWTAILGRPLWQMVFGLIIILIAAGVLKRLRLANYAAMAVLGYEGIRALILCVATSDFRVAGREIGDSGAALISIMFLANSQLRLRPQSGQQQ